jgi:hypothetical protein
MRLLVFFTTLAFLSCTEKAKQIETKNSQEKSEIEIIKEFMPQLNGIWYSGKTVEHWRQINDSCFQAYVYDYKTLDTLERIDVYPMEGAYIFAPTVYGQNDDDPIFFEFKSLEGDKISFTNPSHDWPKEISYQRPRGDSLLAVVSGTDEGEYKELGFSYGRFEEDHGSDPYGIIHIPNHNKYLDFLSAVNKDNPQELLKWLRANKHKFYTSYIRSTGDYFGMAVDLFWICRDNDTLKKTADKIKLKSLYGLFDLIHPDSTAWFKGPLNFDDFVVGYVIKLDSSYTKYSQGLLGEVKLGKLESDSFKLIIDDHSFRELKEGLDCLDCETRYRIERIH